ncbi:septation protein SepH [Gordonia sp. NB41Y]|uniref:septation protein SepH n=1 Tax=Gordonia sp. NB41Y TaxID=875808 RepID=UPI0006B1A94E|nr:septation protein SepH [Gordonia sp. NB41Y]EMP10859.2 hypothetical protein ISGA_4763 [Gordonia sp. NB41Y]WLP89582.1 septation protein SepH [Gordonia sp. NB41Y]
MRELRVVGVDAEGSRVIFQDPESGEKFTVPADERLRAAARGDLSRLGQIEIEMTSALRPREIQARIRAGATVAEVAAIAGVGTDKIERFAHPVLLERTRAAELAALSHPIRHDGPSESTLADATTEALVAFGVNPADSSWDAWKGDDGHWAVQVSWNLGHTEHRAHWRFQPGSHGGTTDPLDDLAEEMTHPELIETRRRLSPVAMPALTPVVEASPRHPNVDVDDDGREHVTFDADSIIGAQRTLNDPRPAPFDEHGTYAMDFEVVEAEYVEVTVETGDERVRPDHPSRAEHDDRPGRDRPGGDPQDDHHDDPADENDDDGSDQHGPKPAPVAAARRRKGRKPAVPAWEDVLLGVRSHPNS